MDFTLKEKIIIAAKYRKYKFINKSKPQFNGETLVILPDCDIAFEMAQLFYERSNENITFLLKDSICSFYSNDIINKSIIYTYNDMNTLGLPRKIFIEKIKSYNFENIVDLNATFSRFGAFLTFYCYPKVKMGFNYDNSKKYYNVILDSNYQQDLEGTFKMIKQFIKI